MAAEISFGGTLITLGGGNGKRWTAATQGSGPMLCEPPTDQLTDRCRPAEAFVLVGVSSNGRVLRAGDVVSIWTSARGGQCLALTAAKRSVELGQTVQALLSQGSGSMPMAREWAPGLQFQATDTGPRCWFRICPCEESAGRVDTALPAPWTCAKCADDNSHSYRSCETCATPRPPSTTERAIRTGEAVTIVPVAVAATHRLAVSRGSEVRCMVSSPARNCRFTFSTIDSVATGSDTAGASDTGESAPGDMSGTAIRTAIISSVANVFTSGIDAGNPGVPDLTGGMDQILSGILATAVPMVADAATAHYADTPGNIITDLLVAANQASDGPAATIATAMAAAAAAAAAAPAPSQANLDLD